MRVLGIDPGSRTGWAVLDDSAPPVAGFEDFHPGRHEGGGMCYLRFRRFLASMLDGSIGLVAYEEVAAHKGTQAAQVYGGFVAQLQALCEERSVPYKGFTVGQVKRRALGKGGGKGTTKEFMVAAARREWPDLDVRDDNVADALWVARCAEEEVR